MGNQGRGMLESKGGRTIFDFNNLASYAFSNAFAKVIADTKR